MSKRCVILVSGTRGYRDRNKFDKTLWKYICSCAKARGIKKKRDVLVIFGCAKSGADRLALNFCKRNDVPYKVFEADWIKYKKGAGHIRNQEMVDFRPTNAIFVWDGLSKGTKDCMDRVSKLGIPNMTVFIDPIPTIEEIAATLFKLLRKHSHKYTESQIENNPKLRRSINRKAIADLHDVYDYLTNKEIQEATKILSR